jgi:exodeoxyribonuclease-3
VRVITFNANGIRSAARKGFFAWAAAEQPDFICLQETRAQEHQLAAEAILLPGYRAYFVDAYRKGYSGVALYTKREARFVVRTCGSPDMDAEGRFIQADLGDLTVASVYVPSGISGAARERVKMHFFSLLREIFDALHARGGMHVVCGDFNVAHEAIDIYDPVRNAGVTGFLPEERAWMDALLAGGAWADAFRLVNREAKQYTWWSNWPKAWHNNLGWRIDYQIASRALADRVRSASIYKEQRFSDHAPLIVDYDLPEFGSAKLP